MIHRTFSLVGFFGFFVTLTSLGQPLSQAHSGPVIEDYGAVYDVKNMGMATPTDIEYRVLFDVNTSPEDAGALNASLNTVARFLNMHARAGVPVENLHAAVVLHGSAGKYALDHAHYEQRFSAKNTNLELMETLHQAGVQIYLCGQTATHRGFAPEQISPVVQVALSAMTVIRALDVQDYTMIAF